MLRPAVAVIATLAVLLAGGMSPAGAHPRSVEALSPTPAPLPAPAALDGQADRAPDFPWSFALAIALAATAFARGRPRRLVVTALVVVLVVFAVESAQHSVHHVFNDQPAACPTALVAEHLSGEPVVTLILEAPSLPVGTRLDLLDPSVSPLGSPDPEHGRAPPSAHV